MRGYFRKIKYWISDWKFRRNHDKNAKLLNGDMDKMRYLLKANDIIKILTELEEKAGLSPFDIVPFLKKIELMSNDHIKTERNNSKFTLDRESNTNLFNELSELGFLTVIENKLYSFHNGIKYPTPPNDSVLIVKLSPKGIDYLIEYRKREKDRFYQKLTIGLLVVASILSLPQACNQTSEWFKKDDTIYKIDIVDKDSVAKENKHPNITDDTEDNIRSGNANIKKITPKPISETTEHKKN
ncbi:hypothetical protein [uncultured Algibacter sp.]|uniref:hypothetical protein n=1 Tax=uncultured Algibacter sp. TaxID=298659 RepID=UPI0026347808|nr:hypothetical protein [uncultured Algibacter sp.]